MEGAFSKRVNAVRTMKTNKLFFAASLVAASAALQSCDDYLDVLPSKSSSLPVTTVEHDIRRYNNNDETFDDVRTISRTFYEITTTSIKNEAAVANYSLKSDSRKYALPINNNEIELSNGQLQQNSY